MPGVRTQCNSRRNKPNHLAAHVAKVAGGRRVRQGDIDLGKSDLMYIGGISYSILQYGVTFYMSRISVLKRSPMAVGHKGLMPCDSRASGDCVAWHRALGRASLRPMSHRKVSESLNTIPLCAVQYSATSMFSCASG